MAVALAHRVLDAACGQHVHNRIKLPHNTAKPECPVLCCADVVQGNGDSCHPHHILHSPTECARRGVCHQELSLTLPAICSHEHGEDF